MRVAPFFLLLACSGLPSPSGQSATGPGSSFTAGQPGASGVSGADGAPGASGAQGPPGKDAQSSGSRIKATYYVGTDGSRQFKAMHDTQLGKDVSGVLLADGKYHWLSQETRSLCGLYFSDSECTQRICWSPGPCYGSQGSWVEGSGCSTSETHIVAVGVLVPDATPIYTLSGANCIAAGSTGTNKVHYRMGAEIPPSTFVEAEIITED